MAQNITLLGASYSNVPAVELPKTGGGTASFTDVTDTTAAASDVASGKYFFTANGVLTLGTNQGGSGDGYVWQDGSGYVHLSDEEGTQPIYDTLNVSGSGTFTPSQGHAYNSVVVPSGTATAPNTISGTSASVSTGTNTLTLAKTVSVTPSVTTAGYVSSGTAGNASVSLTASVNTRSSSDLSASGDTVTVPSGYYANSASKAVAAGTAGTPTATKGTVSSHSIAITPSVTNTAGYISGGTKTGTAVSVSASELVSGTKSIIENGTGIDVTNYASVDVAVPTGSPTLITKNITANGTYNASSDSADGYSSVTVNVSGGGGGLVYETGTWTPTDDVENHDILFTNQHNTAPFYYSIILDITTYNTSTYTMYSLIYVDWYTLLGAIHYANTTGPRYGSIDRKYKASSSTVLSAGNAYLTTSTSSGSFCTNEKIVASGNGNYWKAGYTYKWLAIWKPTT